METKNDFRHFAKWYYSLTAKEAKRAKNLITSKCQVNRVIFYNWLSGKTLIPDQCRMEIDTIAGKPIFHDQP